MAKGLYGAKGQTTRLAQDDDFNDDLVKTTRVVGELPPHTHFDVLFSAFKKYSFTQ